jgi:hypothetical protein
MQGIGISIKYGSKPISTVSLVQLLVFLFLPSCSEVAANSELGSTPFNSIVVELFL